MPSPFANPGAIPTVTDNVDTATAEWADAIRDRAVNNFATAAARDAAILSPVEGMVAHCADTHTTWEYDGVAWRLPWNLPWGIVGDAVVAGDQGGITTVADITSATVPWTAVANRRYRVMVSCIIQNTGAGNGNNIAVTDSGGTSVRAGSSPNVAAATNQLVSYEYEETGLPAGATTRKLRGTASAGTLSVKGSSVATTQIVVEDAGPNGTPT